MKPATLIAPLLFLCAFSAYAQPAQVVGVLDGDTVDLLLPNKGQMRCRLAGIDAPEKTQPFGQASKRHLSEMVYLRAVDVHAEGKPDLYGRSICRIRVDGQDVNFSQVRDGFAWVYRRYSSDPLFIAAETAAKVRRVGLWGDISPTPPWEYRHKRSKGNTQYSE